MPRSVTIPGIFLEIEIGQATFAQLVKFPTNVSWHVFGKISNRFYNLLNSIAIETMYKATLYQICRQILQVVFFLLKILKISGQNYRQN